MAAVILRENDENNISSLSPVAIDIEYISDRVSRIISRFLRPDEEASTLFQQLVCWCAKETAYKFFSSQHLEFLDMRILPFELSAKAQEYILGKPQDSGKNRCRLSYFRKICLDLYLLISII